MPFEMFPSSNTWTNFIIKSPEELDNQLFISQRDRLSVSTIKVAALL